MAVAATTARTGAPPGTPSPSVIFVGTSQVVSAQAEQSKNPWYLCNSLRHDTLSFASIKRVDSPSRGSLSTACNGSANAPQIGSFPLGSGG
ncbi:hypothetical protein K437DRAFT_256743 [Tilletiaria anomala UBC 951]|uniref:Uncharacterized protein n=1 Tax=Tilletiaria anomala (strain ATCC 24038 / CBS 436.72 / UBC 951) TaxID=1037660 RepID=A0A066W2R0_TILAU|nr:uncharacterized protein K437DRAFT_256743 [Tilletiaria anomala UBC 951]KDN45085.1 hypothetical protein K437DRAFT_256743 [Tilletiaria anomala UBC 951]